MWDILTEYGAALSGGALEPASQAPMRIQAEAESAAPAALQPSTRPLLDLLRAKVSRP